MFGRLFLVPAALAAGFAAALLVTQWPGRPQTAGGPLAAADAGGEARESGGREGGGEVRLTPDEIAAAGIEVAAAQPGPIVRRIMVPGSIVPHADHIVHVSVKVSGTLAELRKKVGDEVAAGEVLAVLESREFADAKSEYLAAKLVNDLQQDLFERDKILFEKKVSSEQQYLRSLNQAQNAKVRNDITRQKLFALGLSAQEIASLPGEPEATLQRQEVRSPIAGRVLERKVEAGMFIGRDDLQTEVFVVADPDPAWVDLAISPVDLPLIAEGANVTITGRGAAGPAEGRLILISPVLAASSRTARAVAEVPNPGGGWRFGAFVTAAVTTQQREAAVTVPSAAIQTMATPVVFVRTTEGFQSRPVVTGESDGRRTEIVAGVRAGEGVAAANSFVLKAELAKALVEE